MGTGGGRGRGSSRAVRRRCSAPGRVLRPSGRRAGRGRSSGPAGCTRRGRQGRADPVHPWGLVRPADPARLVALAHLSVLAHPVGPVHLGSGAGRRDSNGRAAAPPADGGHHPGRRPPHLGVLGRRPPHLGVLGRRLHRGRDPPHPARPQCGVGSSHPGPRRSRTSTTVGRQSSLRASQALRRGTPHTLSETLRCG